ncbi:MAG TPA: dihydrofolate reductase family protein [Actinomycetota bacterium]|nr:dihydrofolate reductase family protein [Actinomycetota bacterium]
MGSSGDSNHRRSPERGGRDGTPGLLRDPVGRRLRRRPRRRFEWAEPDEEVHAFINDLERSVGTHLLGRRMYEVLLAWETMHTVPDLPAHISEFADLWRSTDKVVYSTTLDAPSSARTRIERTFDADAVSSMKESAERDLAVGGPTLAARAFEAGLVDECLLFLVPAVVGDGTRSLPEDLDLRLELLDERRFPSGFVFLRYRVT